MELELGLKITRTRDDVSSSVDFRFSKDPFGPLVLSRETDSRFIIIIHLKGFKKEGIEIEINEEGNRITIRGRKPVEEMVLIRWMAWRKEVEFRVFKKVFLIPNIVDLDKIKARFDDDDSTLTITMPKSVKGISGFKIEEEEEEERMDLGEVSEVENREEMKNEEENKEKESHVLGEEEETENDNLEKTQQIDYFGSKKTEKQQLDEQVDRTSKSGEAEKETTDDNDDGDGLSKVQGMVTGEIGEGLEPKIAETETNAEEFESDKLEANEEEEEETSKVGEKDEETKLQEETQEKDSKGQRRHDKKEMVEEDEIEVPEEDNLGKTGYELVQVAETSIPNDTPKQVQERCEGEDKKNKGTTMSDAGAKKVQEIIRQQELDEPSRCKNESKTQELVKSKTNDEEKEKRQIAKTETMEQESYKPKIIGEQEKIKERAEEKIKFSRKVKGKDVESEKKTTETDKRIMDNAREEQEIKKKDSDVSEKYGKEDMIHQVLENREEKKDEADKPEKIRGTIEQELVNLNSQMKQDNIQEGEKTQELVEEETKDCKEEEAKTDDDVARKVQGTKEQESYETKRDHVSKIKELVQDKTGDHEKEKEEGKEIPELERESDLRKVHGGEKPKIHKERDKSRITETEKPSVQEKIEERPESHEKRYRIQEVVEAEYNDRKELETKDNKARAMEDNEIVERRTNTKDGSLRKVQDEEDHEKQEQIQELVEKNTKKNTANDTPKHLNQGEEYKEKITESGKKFNDANAREFQEIIRQQDLDEPARCEKESKTQELVKSKTNEEEKGEKEIAGTKTKEQNFYRPKVPEEQEKIQKLAEKKTTFSRKDDEEEEIAERNTEFCEDDDDNSSRKDGDSDEMKGQEEKDTIQELVLQEKVSDGSKGIIPEAETITENDKSKKVQEIDEQQSQDVDKRGKQIKKLVGGGENDCREDKDVEKEKKTRETDKRIREVEEIKQKDSYVSEETDKEDKIQENRVAYQNEHEEEKKDENDTPETISGRIEQVLVKEGTKDCKEEEEKKDKDTEESKAKTSDDVARKVQGTKEQDLYEPKREHVNKIKERVKEKSSDHKKEIVELERESGLRKIHGGENQEPEIQKEHDKSQIIGAEQPSGQEKEKIVEHMTITENVNSIDVEDIIKEKRPESLEKRYKFQKVLEAGHDDRKEEEEKVIAKAEVETEKEKKSRAMEENEIVERRTETKDGNLRKVQDVEDHELSKPYKRQEENKIQELMELETSDYKEKVKKQDGNDILRSQEAGEPERHGEQSNIPRLAEGEKVEKIAEAEGKLEDNNSGKFHKFEERKSYKDWTHEEHEKDFVNEEASNPKDQQSGGEDHEEEQKEAKVIAKEEMKTEEDSSKKVKEIEKEEYDELERCMVQDKMQETEEKDNARAMEENEIVKRGAKTKDASLRKIQESEDPVLRRHGEVDSGELERQFEQRKIEQSVEDGKIQGKMENISEPCGKMEGDSSGRFNEFQKKIENLVKEEATDDPKDKHTGVGEEIIEKFSQAKTKVEDESNKKVGKHQELDKVEGVLRERANDREKGEENLMDDFVTNIQETEKEESREADRHKKLDIAQNFVEDKTRNQEDEKLKEAAALVAHNEKDSSRKLHLLKEHELKEPEEHKEQNKIFETSVPGVKEEDEERVAEKKIKEKEAHVQELVGKTESYKDDNGEGKQRKIAAKKIYDRIVRKIQETKLQELNREKDQEPEDKKIEELERTKPVKLVTEDDSCRQGQEFLENVSKRRLVEQEKFDELKKVKKRGGEEEAEVETEIKEGKSGETELFEILGLDAPEESEERKKIQQPVEEKTREEEMQDKIQEPIVEITKHHREAGKGMEEREGEEMKRIAKDFSSRMAQKMKAQESDGSEKHWKASEVQEKHNSDESVEEMNEEGRYNAALKEDSRKSQDVKEKGSDQEQEKIEEQFVVEERKKENDVDKRGKREQKEKTERNPRLEAKTNDDDDRSRKSEIEEQEPTRLREQKKRVKNQRLVGIETSDQSKEKKEDVRKGKTEAAYNRSCKIQDNEEDKSYKQEKLEETRNRKEGTVRNRTVRGEEETKTRDDGCRKVEEIEEQELAVTHNEQENNQELVKKDTADQTKVKKDQETKNIDDTSRYVKEDAEQESSEHKRNKEQEKNVGLVADSGKVDKEIAYANGSRKLKEIEERESNEVEKEENPDDIQEFGEENMINQEEDDNEITNKEIEAKPKDHESKRLVRLKEQDKTQKPVHRKTNNRKDEETTNKETTTKESESRKKQENKEQEISEQIRLEEQETSEHMRLEEQERIQKLVEDRTSDIVEDGNSKKIQEIEKEESIEPGRYEKPDKIQKSLLNMETSEDDEEEELEIEFEESEEDWEAEVIQEMDSDEENDEIRQIKRIKLGFRLVGGSTLFMSLIVIVISFIHSKKKIRCYKF